MDEARADVPMQQGRGAPSDAAILRNPGLHRRALFDELDACRAAGTSVWISARAGAGKTTLVRTYAAARRLPVVAWCPAAPGADPAAFLSGFAGAVERAVPGASLDPTAASDPPSVRRLLDNCFACLSRPSIVLFDDMHLLHGDACAAAALRLAIDAAPPAVTVVVAGRRLPPPVFSRLRVSGRLALIDDERLRFDADEARSLLAIAGVGSASEIDRILVLADGWAAGLVLLARQQGASGAVPDLVHDYLKAEVLDALPPPCRRLLAHTARLPFVPEAVAVALTGDANAPGHLHVLARECGFVRRSPGSSPTYEVHPLLRAALVARCAGDGSTSPALRAMHVAAARLLTEGGQVEAAAALFIDATEWTGVSALVLRHAHDLVIEGKADVLEGWLRALPPACVEEDPWLMFWSGICVRPSDPGAALSRFERAWRGFETRGSVEGALSACCGVLEVLPSDQAGRDAGDLWLDRLAGHLPWLPAASLSPAMEILFHGALTRLLRCRPDHVQLLSLAERAGRILADGGHPAARLAAGCFAWRHGLLQGDLRAQARVRAVADGLVAAPGVPLPLRVAWFELEAQHLCAVLDFSGAIAAIEGFRDLVREAGPGPWVAELAWCSACAAAGAGDLPLAEAAVAGIAGFRGTTDAWHRHRLAAVRAMAALLRRDPEAARVHLEAEIDVIDGLRAPAAEVDFLQLAAVTFAKCGAIHAAGACLARAERTAAAAGLGAQRRSGCFARAYVALAAGEGGEAVAALRAGIGLAREQGCPNWGTALTPAIVARLAGAALEAGIEPGWVREIIRKRHLVPDGPPVDAWPWPVRIHTLGRFTVLCRDEEVRFVGRSQRKPMELLETLLALGGREVGAARVAAALWPQSDGDSAANTLGTTLHRLRKLLGEDATITLVDGRLTLDPRLVWVDTWAFERSVSECESQVAADASPEAVTTSFEAVMRRYRGHFLPANEGGPGVLARRERLHARFRRIAEVVADLAVARSDPAADALCQRILDIDPLAEPIYRALMRSLASQGRHGEALEICARAERLLTTELGRGLSPATRALRRAIGDALGGPGA